MARGEIEDHQRGTRRANHRRRGRIPRRNPLEIRELYDHDAEDAVHRHAQEQARVVAQGTHAALQSTAPPREQKEQPARKKEPHLCQLHGEMM